MAPSLDSAGARIDPARRVDRKIAGWARSQAVVEALAPVVEEVAAIAEELKKMKAQFQAFKAEPAATKIKRNDFSAERTSAVDRILQIRKQK